MRDAEFQIGRLYLSIETIEGTAIANTWVYDECFEVSKGEKGPQQIHSFSLYDFDHKGNKVSQPTWEFPSVESARQHMFTWNGWKRAVRELSRHDSEINASNEGRIEDALFTSLWRDVKYTVEMDDGVLPVDAGEFRVGKHYYSAHGCFWNQKRDVYVETFVFNGLVESCCSSDCQSTKSSPYFTKLCYDDGTVVRLKKCAFETPESAANDLMSWDLLTALAKGKQKRRFRGRRVLKPDD